jgi:hypothetical protein
VCSVLHSLLILVKRGCLGVISEIPTTATPYGIKREWYLYVGMCKVLFYYFNPFHAAGIILQQSRTEMAQLNYGPNGTYLFIRFFVVYFG